MSDHARAHPRDIDEHDLQRALAESPRADLLQTLVNTSRHTFGFFTGHIPHTINYPWVLDRLASLEKGARVLDIGAGISPVPVVLAASGMQVTCIDSNPVVRTLPADDSWSEWGFFNYGALGNGMAAQQCPVADYAPVAPLDAIYSVSVLAHMPAHVWRDTLDRCATWLRPGGVLLLAIDLIPVTDFLWCRSEGREIEPPVLHGTVSDLSAHLLARGFLLQDVHIRRNVRGSRTDLLFMHATRDGVAAGTPTAAAPAPWNPAGRSTR